MSIDLFAAALWLDLPPARKLVLAALCDRAENATGKCWPGRQEISIRASVSLHTVTTHLQALEADGWLRSGRRPGRAGQTTTRWVSVDRILGEGERRRAGYLLATRGAGEDSTLADGAGEVDARAGEVSERASEAASLVTVTEPSQEPSARDISRNSEYSTLKLSQFPRSQGPDVTREPDAIVEQWIIMRLRKKWGDKAVMRGLRDHGDSFFIWRKALDVNGATLRDALDAARAETESEVVHLQARDADYDGVRDEALV